MSRSQPQPDATALAAERFKRHFGHTPSHRLQVPGRVELFGTPADHDDGLSLAAAVNWHAALAAAPRTDGRIELVATADDTVERFWMSESPPIGSAWAHPLKSVLEALRGRGAHFSGFNAALHSNIPPALDVGAEGAARVAAALMVRRLYPYSLTERGITLPPRRDERGDLPQLKMAERLHLARLCAKAGGGNDTLRLVDTLTPLAAKAWSVLSLDAATGTVDHAPVPGVVLIAFELAGSNVTTMVERAGMRELCQAAARKLRVKTLRTVDHAWLRANQAALDARERTYVAHVVGERARVTAAERALREDDLPQLGAFLWQSQESWCELSAGESEETDLLLKLARRHPGCLGARAISGGTMHLVAYHEAEGFMADIRREYEALLGSRPLPRVCQLVEGAG